MNYFQILLGLNRHIGYDICLLTSKVKHPNQDKIHIKFFNTFVSWEKKSDLFYKALIKDGRLGVL